MFALTAAIVFATALSLAVGTMAYMFATYHDKMMAALLYKPANDLAPIYHVAVRRGRAAQPIAMRPMPVARQDPALLPLAA